VANLNRLLERLCDSDIEFVVVGGFAAMLHGSALLTRDLDVCAVVSSATVDQLRATLKDLNPTHRFTPQRLNFLSVPASGVELKNLYLETDLGPIDVLGSILGVGDFAAVKSRAVQIDVFGRKCWLLSLEDLIVAKEAVGRDKDKLAAKELRAIAAKRAQRASRCS
jgi:predicted nucleotidyltransferase